MKTSYPASIKAVLRSEGGYSNNPSDPGGETNFGVTKAVYDAYRARLSMPQQSVKHISSGEVQDIYKVQYWDAVFGDALPAGVDYAVFDYAVNSGPSRAIKALQTALAVAVDGQIGPATILAATAADPVNLINMICTGRLNFMMGLSTWGTFGNGWSSRVKSVRSDAIQMARTATAAPQLTPTPPVPVPAPVAPKPQTPLPAPIARPALSLWARLIAFLKPRPVGNRLIGDVSTMNGMKTYILTTILGTLSAALGATGTLDPKTGIGGVLVAAILFALRHGLSTGIATIIASLAGFVQQALATLRPNEANIAGIVKSAVTEALAEQAAAATATTVATQAAAAAVKAP